jgi:hypothetical protein
MAVCVFPEVDYKRRCAGLAAGGRQELRSDLLDTGACTACNRIMRMRVSGSQALCHHGVDRRKHFQCDANTLVHGDPDRPYRYISVEMR